MRYLLYSYYDFKNNFNIKNKRSIDATATWSYQNYIYTDAAQVAWLSFDIDGRPILLTIIQIC